MKLIIYTFISLYLVSCNDNQEYTSYMDFTDERVNSILRIFKSNRIQLNHTENWEIRNSEMLNNSSPALIALSRNTGKKRWINFQILNLVDESDLEVGVRNFAKKFTHTKSNKMTTIVINKRTFIQKRLELADGSYSESFFTKKNNNLFWLSFIGTADDLESYEDEIMIIVETFKIK